MFVVIKSRHRFRNIESTNEIRLQFSYNQPLSFITFIFNQTFTEFRHTLYYDNVDITTSLHRTCKQFGLLPTHYGEPYCFHIVGVVKVVDARLFPYVTTEQRILQSGNAEAAVEMTVQGQSDAHALMQQRLGT
jgi:hypothetical protein